MNLNFLNLQKPSVQSLLESLRDYGLNPAEWMLRRQPRETFQIVHRQNRDFVFEGQLARQGSKHPWKSITLISI